MTNSAETITPRLQYGKACRPTRGEDRVFAFELAGGRALLIGVADGLSSENGRAAAEWIETTMHNIATNGDDKVLSARELFKRVTDELAHARDPAETVDSLSTLSCGICELRYTNDTVPILRFEFFAVGDSPIWRVAPIKPSGGLIFQANVVYDSPTPREQGLVYSFVSLLDRKIEGRPHFGSVELAEDELLVIASDGVPEWRIFGEDQDPKYNVESPKLIECVLGAPLISDELLRDTLFEYDRHGMLIDDDASIVVVRWRYPREVFVQPQEASTSRSTVADAVERMIAEPSGSSAISSCIEAPAVVSPSGTLEREHSGVGVKEIKKKEYPVPRNRRTAKGKRKGRSRRK